MTASRTKARTQSAESGEARTESDASGTAGSTDSKVSPSRVALCVFLTWWFPGLGHWLLHKRAKAILYFGAITSLFLLGLVIGEFRVVRLDHFWLHFVGQVFYAGLTLPVWLATGGLRLEPGVDPGGVTLEFPLLDVGVLFTTIAGLLNVCVMVDVYESAYPRPQSQPASGSASGAAA